MIFRMRSIFSGGAKGVSLDLNNANKINHLHNASENEKEKRSFKLPFRRKHNTVIDGNIGENSDKNINKNIDENDENDENINSKLGINIMPIAVFDVQVVDEVHVDGQEAHAQADQPPAQLQPQPQPQPLPQDEQKPPKQPMNVDDDAKTACTLALLALFPDICPDFLQETSERLLYDYESVVSHLLDQIDDGKPYPHRQSLKRKRLSEGQPGSASASASSSSNAASIKGKGGGIVLNSADIIAGLDEDDSIADSVDAHNLEADEADEAQEAQEAYTQRAIAAFSTKARIAASRSKEYTKQACILLRQANIKVPQKYIASFLAKHKNCLLPALLALDDMHAKLDLQMQMQMQNGAQLPYKEKVRGTLVVDEYTLPALPATILAEKSPVMRDILIEYKLALQLRDRRRFWRQEKVNSANREAANQAQAEMDGAVRECECCCADVPLNRTVHCANAEVAHLFCRDCARRMAETQIGLGRYDLTCMSMDNCEASFSRAQQSLFLSKKTARALERIEQDFVLRVAGLEGLARCPFCPFAAEYPPVDVNKEFACQNPACEVVSCRLCQKETHIPMTCREAESARGERPSARLLVEEAMSRAMIRSCNKCATPFIKEHGCNKMTCTNAGCSNVQCYVCHTSCDYSHFDDTTRGGKKGNCPLFEDAEERHDQEVQAAEAKARADVVEKNPGIDVDSLQFKLSGKVLDDERRRRKAEQGPVAA